MTSERQNLKTDNRETTDADRALTRPPCKDQTRTPNPAGAAISLGPSGQGHEDQPLFFSIPTFWVALSGYRGRPASPSKQRPLQSDHPRVSLFSTTKRPTGQPAFESLAYVKGSHRHPW